jgi:hypothetical protein
MLCSPRGPSTQLDEVAGKLNSEYALTIEFDERERQEIWLQLALVGGLIERESQRPDANSVAAEMLKLQADCEHFLQLFGPFRGGIWRRDDAQFAAAAAVLELLAINPEIGSHDAAHRVLERFMTTAEQFRQASAVARMEVQGVHGKPGRNRLKWHDAFTSMLVGIAERKQIKVVLSLDRGGGDLSTFLRLAELMEEFLPEEVRARSQSARVKRLHRSRKRLAERLGHKPL